MLPAVAATVATAIATVETAATTFATAAATTVAATATAAAATTAVAAATTAAATTVAAASATATTACRTFFTWTGFIDSKLTAHEFLAVLSIDRGIHGFCRVHGHEGKATRTAAFAIHREEDFGDTTVLGKQLTNVLFLSGEGQIAHVHLGIHIFRCWVQSSASCQNQPRSSVYEHQRIQNHLMND